MNKMWDQLITSKDYDLDIGLLGSGSGVDTGQWADCAGAAKK